MAGKGGSGKGGGGGRTGGKSKGPERRTVQARPGGGWDVVRPGGKRASAHTDTQVQAMQRGREILGNIGGGELTIKGKDGKIRDSDTVAPGNDPNPPRDTK
ncbi:MAG: DUF2188 domain-containing protein [Chloroflexi bacterium]|nr:DUF2188 domain-containing protein [Chloroflexota bacterium]